VDDDARAADAPGDAYLGLHAGEASPRSG
jgi:hypothetical protein